MKGKHLKIMAFVAAVAAALCMFVVACPGQGSGGGSDALTDPADGRQASEEASGGRVDAANEDWPGQADGYVGPNGEGVLDRDDFETEEGYRDAAIDAAGKAVDVPSEIAFARFVLGDCKTMHMGDIA